MPRYDVRLRKGIVAPFTVYDVVSPRDLLANDNVAARLVVSLKGLADDSADAKKVE